MYYRRLELHFHWQNQEKKWGQVYVGSGGRCYLTALLQYLPYPFESSFELQSREGCGADKRDFTGCFIFY